MNSNNSILILFCIGSLQIQTFVLVWDKIFGISLVKCWFLSLHNCCACNERADTKPWLILPPCPHIGAAAVSLTHLQPKGGFGKPRDLCCTLPKNRSKVVLHFPASWELKSIQCYHDEKRYSLLQLLGLFPGEISTAILGSLMDIPRNDFCKWCQGGYTPSFSFKTSIYFVQYRKQLEDTAVHLAKPWCEIMSCSLSFTKGLKSFFCFFSVSNTVKKEWVGIAAYHSYYDILQ